MRIFISGGCKNGKSTYAQKVAKKQKHNGDLYYIATMISSDSEDEERIIRHQQEREGWGFTTIEQQKNIEGILSKCDLSGSFLLDSLTALLANEMFSRCGGVDQTASERVGAGLASVLLQVENIVIVSDYIYSDAIVYDPLTEAYRKSLAALDRFVAEKCDVVLEVTFIQIMIHKFECEKLDTRHDIRAKDFSSIICAAKQYELKGTLKNDLLPHEDEI